MFIISENKETTIVTATELYSDSDFIRYNEQQHNRFSAAINKLLEFIGAEIPKKQSRPLATAATSKHLLQRKSSDESLLC